jgi:hypothetical protein
MWGETTSPARLLFPDSCFFEKTPYACASRVIWMVWNDKAIQTTQTIQTMKPFRLFPFG